MRNVVFAAFAAAFCLAAQPKTAEQAFKNITQLKGTPADQLLPSMQFMTASLGVECAFCHVEGKMELDDKPQKKTARAMMALTAAINKDSFGGRQQVTCYSCHHGSSHPAAVPPVLDSNVSAHNAPALERSSLTAADIIEKYISAAGGEDAMKKTTSRVMKGAITAGGNESPIELLTRAPNKRISITHTANGESYTAFDGTSGWLGTSGRPARDMSAAESAAAGLDAEFYLPLRLKQIFASLSPGRPERIGDVEFETLIGRAPDRPLVRLYFDKSSGLLVRMVRYAETPLGRNPTQIDYADYRTVDGVKIPFRWTLSRPNGRFTVQITDVQTNVPVDDARFRKP